MDDYSKLTGRQGTTGTGSSDPAVAIVEGYASRGDGGGGTFVWTADTASADDGGTIIVPSGTRTGCWKRQFSGPVDPRWFGAKCDGSTDDSSALTAAMSASLAVRIPKATRLASDVTVPEGVTLHFDSSAVVSPDSGKILQINGRIVAPASPIFGGSGKVRINWRHRGAIYPEWFGAQALSDPRSGTEDSTAALQAMFQSVQGAIYNSTSGYAPGQYDSAEFVFGGIYGISDEIRVNVGGHTIRGAGPGLTGSGLKWVGTDVSTNATKAMLRLFGPQYAKVEGLIFLGLPTTTDPNRLYAGLALQSSGSVPSPFNAEWGRRTQITRCLFGDSTGYFTMSGAYQFQHGIVSDGDDGNDDFHEIDDVVFIGCENNITIGGAQNVYWRIVNTGHLGSMKSCIWHRHGGEVIVEDMYWDSLPAGACVVAVGDPAGSGAPDSRISFRSIGGEAPSAQDCFVRNLYPYSTATLQWSFETYFDQPGNAFIGLAKNSAVTHSGTGTSVMTVTGAANDYYRVKVKVLTGGPRGTFTFAYSLNGGAYSSAITSAATYAIPGTGVTLNFSAAGSTDGVVNDEYSFLSVAGVQPMFRLSFVNSSLASSFDVTSDSPGIRCTLDLESCRALSAIGVSNATSLSSLDVTVSNCWGGNFDPPPSGLSTAGRHVGPINYRRRFGPGTASVALGDAAFYASTQTLANSVEIGEPQFGVNVAHVAKSYLVTLVGNGTTNFTNTMANVVPANSLVLGCTAAVLESNYLANSNNVFAALYIGDSTGFNRFATIRQQVPAIGVVADALVPFSIAGNESVIITGGWEVPGNSTWTWSGTTVTYSGGNLNSGMVGNKIHMTSGSLAGLEGTVTAYVNSTTLTVDTSRSGSGSGVMFVPLAASKRMVVTPVYVNLIANPGVLAINAQNLLYAEPYTVS